MKPMNDEMIPAEAVRFVEFRPEPQVDQSKIRLYIQKTNAQEHPDIELMILNADGKLVAETNLIAVMQKNFVLTMHIPQSEVKSGTYTLIGKINFDEPIGLVEEKQVSFELST